MKNVGHSRRGRSQGVPENFSAPMYRAHCAVIFAIAQLSCFRLTCCLVATAAVLSECLRPLIPCSYILAAVQPPKPTGNAVMQRSASTVRAGLDSEVSSYDAGCG